MELRTVGVIGLGQIGKAAAKNLIKKGFRVTVCGHVRKEPVEELKALGAATVGSPKEVAKAREVIISVVRDIPQTEEVIEGKGFWEGKGVWQGIKSGATIIISSTLEPPYCQKLAMAGKEKGIHVLDAPVSGGKPAAEAGTLTFMVGGHETAFEKCRPIFEAMGKNIFYLGGHGMGQAFKLVNNIMWIATAFDTSEAIALGLKAGLELERILEVTKVSSGNSAVVQNWDLMTAFKEDYERRKEASNLAMVHKDLEIALKFAEDLEVPVPLTRFVSQMDLSRLFPKEPPH